MITTGPYALVRHPLYVGAILFYTLFPLALGSYWAMILAALIIPLLVRRICDEEILLHKELPGYTEYTERLRYRMIPGVW
ncbi:MAG: isoprenylcysteine carboxylmethyltransferase family protein [Anaerolineaceae bacterium]